MAQNSLLTIARNFILPLVAAALLAGCGGGGNGAVAGLYNQPTRTPSPTSTSTPTPGAVLSTAMLNGAAGFVNSAGHTVYVFDADLVSPGHSVCNGACAQQWPPVAPPAGITLQAPFSSITRADGSAQLAHAGRPLYTFFVDTRVGDTFGDGLNAFGALWHIARP